MITMRDWNVPVRTCRVIGYQQTVNSTFIEMSYLGGDAYISEEVEDVRQKEMTSVKQYDGFFRNCKDLSYPTKLFYFHQFAIQELL